MTNKKIEGITCPLCGAFAPYKEIKKNTHIWVCEEACSFVGMEFATERQLETITAYLLRDQRANTPRE